MPEFKKVEVGCMTVQDCIEWYLSSLDASKQSDLRQLHLFVLQEFPGIRLWFLDGKDATGKIVSNPNVGYGETKLRYKDGSFREFYRVGFSATTKGLSVYFMGQSDKARLSREFGERIGKASISGYCIQFKSLEQLNLIVLKEAIRFGINHS